jgi:peptidoglycan/xylan/chitin deacetylase (PgdA/CDA1 family)/pimeloyl-ACP methyl ester carboxylesterase
MMGGPMAHHVLSVRQPRVPRLRPLRVARTPALATTPALASTPALVALVGLLASLLLGVVASPTAAGGGSVVSRGPDTNRTVALTFDDGYAPERCLQIADILTDFGIPATWFPNGMYVRSAPKAWRSIGRRFPIANHTLSHPSLVDLSAEGIREELLGNERTIERITGRPMLHLLRPTFGAYDDRVVRVAEGLGYRLVLWTISAADTSPNGTDRGIAKRALTGGPGSIILMHCGPEVTPRILPIVIARYACDGYRFAALDDLLAGGPGVAAEVSCPPPKLPAAEKRRTAQGPDAEVDDAGLAPFLEQVPAWEPCDDGLECATIEVPIDYAEPAAGSVDIRVSRARATGEPTGTLVLGPKVGGGSGIESFPALRDAVGDTLLPALDLVAFDPRGTGGSDPLACLDGAGLDALLAADPTTGPGESVPMLASLGAACAANAGPLAAHMTTVEIARDLDILRAVLGREHLDYYGTAYGSVLGTTYAALYPERVGRMVLDGAIDPALSQARRELDRAAGLERTLRAYADACLGAGGCSLGSTPEDVVASVASVLAAADARPLPTGDPARPLTQQLAFRGILAALEDPGAWATLTTSLGAALGGDGDPLLRLADAAVGRGPDGYRSNLLTASAVVTCQDTQLVARDAIPALETFVSRSPTFGAILHGLASGCERWPLAPSVATPDRHAPRAAPVVVIGTTDDPVTPYRWAKALARRLDSGVLVTRDGDGDRGYGTGNACVDDAVNAYLLEGRVPEDGLSC